MFVTSFLDCSWLPASFFQSLPSFRNLAEVKMPFVKVVKNKAYFKRYQVGHYCPCQLINVSSASISFPRLAGQVQEEARGQDRLLRPQEARCPGQE